MAAGGGPHARAAAPAIYRTHRGRRGGWRQGLPEVDDARRREAAHQPLAGPLVGVWDHRTTPASAALAEIIAARR